MNKEWDFTQELFDALLTWLDQDREQAGQKYENIRRRLIKIFACRGCLEPEDLADETINRVARKVPEITDVFTGDPALYFYGVAKNIFMEHLRRKPTPAPPPQQPSDEVEQEYACLEHCIEQLTSDNRELVLQYYQEEKSAKIDYRKRLASRLGIALNALRIRAHRIRASLQKCVEDCLERQAT